MNRKAQEGGTLSIITKAVLVLVILVILLLIFRKYFGQGAGIIDAELCGLEHDQDADGIADVADKCPCDNGEPAKCTTTIKDCRRQISQSAECAGRRG